MRTAVAICRLTVADIAAPDLARYRNVGKAVTRGNVKAIVRATEAFSAWSTDAACSLSEVV